jgi:hypothetical protein
MEPSLPIRIGTRHQQGDRQMKILSKALVLAGIAALAACNKPESPAAENVVENAENTADSIENAADQLLENAENTADAMKEQAENVVDKAENKAAAIDEKTGQD